MPKIFCSNCDTIAVYIVQQTGTALCKACADAYEWGQNAPKHTLAEVNDWWNEILEIRKEKKGD